MPYWKQYGISLLIPLQPPSTYTDPDLLPDSRSTSLINLPITNESTQLNVSKILSTN